jgi:hypothetical protein
MAHRKFADENARDWDGWDVNPSEAEKDATRALPVPARLRAGWLAFESSDERRRLVPIPDDWEQASESVLRRWCYEAETIMKR